MTVVASDGHVLYAAGTIGLVQGVVWRSMDGDTWEVAGTGTAFALGECHEGCPTLESIAVGPSGVVVLGYRVEVVSGRVTSEAAIWSSPDGTAWHRSDEPDLRPPGSVLIHLSDVTVGGPGLVVVGERYTRLGGAGRAIALTSTDGRSWEPAADLPDGARVGMQRIVPGPAGGVIALGRQCTEDGACTAATWWSADGAAWERTTTACDTLWNLHGLLALAGRTAVMIGIVDHQVIALTSTDGRGWTLQPASAAFPGEHELAISDLAGGPAGVLAVGTDEDLEVGQVWLSPAGG